MFWRQSSRWICVSTTLSAKSSTTWPLRKVIQSQHVSTILDYVKQWCSIVFLLPSCLFRKKVEGSELWTSRSLRNALCVLEAYIMHPGLQKDMEATAEKFSGAGGMIFCIYIYIYHLYANHIQRVYQCISYVIVIIQQNSVGVKSVLQFWYIWFMPKVNPKRDARLRLVILLILHRLL